MLNMGIAVPVATGVGLAHCLAPLLAGLRNATALPIARLEARYVTVFFLVLGTENIGRGERAIATGRSPSRDATAEGMVAAYIAGVFLYDGLHAEIPIQEAEAACVLGAVDHSRVDEVTTVR